MFFFFLCACVCRPLSILSGPISKSNTVVKGFSDVILMYQKVLSSSSIAPLPPVAAYCWSISRKPGLTLTRIVYFVSVFILQIFPVVKKKKRKSKFIFLNRQFLNEKIIFGFKLKTLFLEGGGFSA